MRHLPAAQPGRSARTAATGVRPSLTAAGRMLAVPIAVLLLGLALASSAQANAGNKILKLCEEKKSLAGFSEKAYSEALQEMSADDAEYSECPNLIAEQEQEEVGRTHRSGATGRGGGSGGVGGGRAGGGSSGGTGKATGEATREPTGEAHGGGGTQPAAPPNAEEQRQIAAVQSTGPEPVAVGNGGAAVNPGVVHATLDSAVSSLPVPLLAAIAALLALIALLAGRAIRDRMRAADVEG